MGIKDISFPFEPTSEEDVRIQLAFYFKELGFKENEMSFEDHFEIKLGHNSIKISKHSYTEKVWGYSDLLLFHNELPLAMVEVKRPDVILDDDHKDQGLSYARLLSKMPPYTIITNGKDFRVYDTITAELLESGSPEDAKWWKNGSTLNGIQDPDRSHAAKKLIQLNFDILKNFSLQQTTICLNDLKGSPFEGYRYSPEIFLKRSGVSNALIEFKNSNKVCFGIYGNSGFGKTATVCHIVEDLNQTNSLVFFYRATRFSKSFTDAIKSDFLWEFNSECTIAKIIKRLETLAAAHSTTIYFIIDGLDEFSDDIKKIKNELIEFSQRIKDFNIRLILTCKSHDWTEFVHDRGEILNSLGHEVFPLDTDLKLPGFHLREFDDNELDDVWGLYSKIYSLSGPLKGETREISRNPLMLRFIAETYKNSAPPSNLSDVEVFRNYWEKKMCDFPSIEQRTTMAIIIGKVSQLMVEKNKEEIEESTLFEAIDPAFTQSTAYGNLFRFYFLQRNSTENNRTLISFPFRKLQAYTFTIISQKWDQKKSPSEIITAINSALITEVGKFSLYFFLSTIDSETGIWLNVLIKNNFPLFLKIYREIFSYNFVYEKPHSPEEKSEKNIQELSERFSKSYSNIWNNLLSLKTRFASSFSGKLYFENEIANLFPYELKNQIPEILAWKKTNEQIVNIFEKRFLNETQSPLILNERIQILLSEEPNWSIEGKIIRNFWELLGFESLNDAQIANYRDLKEKAISLFKKWREIAFNNKYTQEQREKYEILLKDLLGLIFFLDSYGKLSKNLSSPDPMLKGLFSYIDDASLENILKIISNQFENIMSSYCSLLKTNFPNLINEFSFYNFRKSQMLIEVSRDDAPFRSDTLFLTYTLLPSVKPSKPIIREVPKKESIAKKFIIGHSSAGNIFSLETPIQTIINDEIVYEEKAITSRTQFPSHHLITEASISNY